MNENNHKQPEDFPEADVRMQRWPSPVWLLPLAAVLIGFWLLFQNWYQRGPTITVQFASAEGVVEGQTEVRYKAVKVGKVKRLRLSDDLEYAEATIELNKEIGRHLGSDAHFWIVRPRVNRSEISGLSTLFSGTYIGMDPGTKGDDLSFYRGEEKPPVITPSENGRRFFLMADSLGSMDIGSPVFYKQLQAGEVIDYKLLSDKNKVRLEVFIRDPYYEFVHADTRFWNASGAEFKMNSAGAEFRMESLVSLLIGGIAFETPDSQEEGKPEQEGAQFPLYASYAESREKHYPYRLYYVMYFDGSVRGLAPGAEVEFQGIPVGQVEKIDMKINRETLDVRIPVLAYIQPQYFDPAFNLEEGKKIMRELVKKGMRAKLETGNLLTGQKLISLSMEKKPEPAEIKVSQFYSEFPTVGSALDDLPGMASDLLAALQDTLDGIKKLVRSGKLDKALDSVNSVLRETEKTIVSARKLLQNVDQKTLPTVTQNFDKISIQLNTSLQKLQGSLTQIDSITANNSPTRYQLDEMLEEVTAASRSVRALTETLQRQPTSILRGKKGE